jgi:hypothetical protein
MAYGPLIGIKTQVAAVRLDVRRSLNYPAGVTLALVKPDGTQLSKWAVLKTYTNGFNRQGPEETDRRDGHTVIFRIADLDNTLRDILRTKDLHALFQGVYYRVGPVPNVPPDVAQVYDLNCAERTLRANFDLSR